MAINGVGGVFLSADDAESLVAWYAEAFGLSFTGNPDEGCWYTSFAWQANGAEGSTTLAIFKSTEPLAKTGRGFRLNLHTDNLDGLLSNPTLQIEKTEEYDYGRFAWTSDPEGNSLELYEPKSPETDG